MSIWDKLKSEMSNELQEHCRAIEECLQERFYPLSNFRIVVEATELGKNKVYCDFLCGEASFGWSMEGDHAIVQDYPIEREFSQAVESFIKMAETNNVDGVMGSLERTAVEKAFDWYRKESSGVSS
jgi:hypothetical protein